MVRIFILIITFLEFNLQIFSQPVDFFKLLPLSVGNTWVYYYQGNYQFYGFQTGLVRYTITGTQVVNGKTYFNFQSVTVNITGTLGCSCSEFQTYGSRIDSSTGVVYVNIPCSVNGLICYDSLKSRLADTSHICYYDPLFDRIVCADTNITPIFSSSHRSKYFQFQALEGGESRRYADNLGIIYYSQGVMQGNCSSNLVGCVINGIVYGDTSLIVGISQLSNKVPESFSLSQNYPNPFNPTTKISFAIPPSKGDRGMSMIRLVIYDALGKEVAVLINEQLKPGTYEVDWDGTNFPSGIYFYKLEIGEFTQTKKMVLIK